MNSSDTGYFCYDIRGIQSYIFQIPRLRYIIGGSALIDRFDRDTVAELAHEHKIQRIFSAGGKGAFICRRSVADDFQKILISKAHAIGADIRFGFNYDYSEAMHCADSLFAYLPENLAGHPCPASGLYPVNGNEEVHKVVQKRDFYDGERMPRRFETRLLDGLELPICLEGRKIEFFHNVDSDDRNNAGKAGCAALGNRNRWAIICMDGNDMGKQFQSRQGNNPLAAEQMLPWVKELSTALDDCSTTACRSGIQAVLQQWVEDPKVKKALKNGDYDDRNGVTILPVRPLVVGGDDIAMLCHAAHASTFVRQACDIFESHSKILAGRARAAKGIELWPATNGRITISAGILYCGTSLPLATAIPYAENLLGMAKKKGREMNENRQGEPSPACVDFESVTESMLDAPASRRHREIEFLDVDLGNQLVRLTRRPYTIAEFADLLEQAKNLELPPSILHQLLPCLRTGFHDRQVFRYRLGKKHKKLFKALEEEQDRVHKDSRWQIKQSNDGTQYRSTDLLDMVILIQEDSRMAKETV